MATAVLKDRVAKVPFGPIVPSAPTAPRTSPRAPALPPLETGFFDLIQRRHSVRRFKHTPIDDALIACMAAAANRAPSAGNQQAYDLIVVKNADVRARIARACGDQSHVEEAPVVLVFCADPGRARERYGARGEQLYCVQDATIACAYAQLAATALGLGSVWVGAIFQPEDIASALGLQPGQWPVALLPIGEAAEEPPVTPRRSLHNLMRTVW